MRVFTFFNTNPNPNLQEEKFALVDNIWYHIAPISVCNILVADDPERRHWQFNSARTSVGMPGTGHESYWCARSQAQITTQPGWSKEPTLSSNEKITATVILCSSGLVCWKQSLVKSVLGSSQAVLNVMHNAPYCSVIFASVAGAASKGANSNLSVADVTCPVLTWEGPQSGSAEGNPV